MIAYYISTLNSCSVYINFIILLNVCSQYETGQPSFVSPINTQVPLEDPKRFRIEMSFSHGANLELLEVVWLNNIY